MPTTGYYDWNLDKIMAGNMGSAAPDPSRGETRIEPASSKHYISSSAAWMKYEIRVPVGDTSKYEETVVVLEPMTSFIDEDNWRDSILFHQDREKGHNIVKAFRDKAESLYEMHKKKFSAKEKADIEDALKWSGEYLRKVKGAIDYWGGHSLLWPMDQGYKDFAYGACDYSKSGKKVTVNHPKYPEIEVELICPTSEEISAHDGDRAKASTLLQSAASYTRFVERMVWPKEVRSLNEKALNKAKPQRVSTIKMAKIVPGGVKPPVKVVMVSAEVLDQEGGSGSGTSSKSSKRKKKSALPLIAAAGIGAMLLLKK